MLRPKHPMAIPIALLLQAERKQHTMFEYAVYEVLNAYISLRDWPEEMCSDLYAQLAEKLNDTQGMLAMENIISECLWNTQERFDG